MNMASKSIAESLDLLIECIQNYEFIYDLKHKHHRDNLKVDNAWQEIANITGMSAENCKRHWKNLRDRFTKEKRLLPSGSAAAESNWHLFDKMLFYNKFSKARRRYTTTSPVNIVESESRPSSSGSSVWSTMEVLLSQGTQEDELEDDVDAETEETHTPKIADGERIESSLSQETPVSRKGKRKRQEKKGEATIDKVLEVARNVAATMQNRPSQKKTPNETFGEYVVACLNDMPPAMAKEKRKLMLDILDA